jgi:predicted transcriptional regulator
MVEQLSIKHNLLSYHLGVLVDEGLLDSHRNGRHITYNIKKTRVTCVKKIFSLVDFENCH